MITEGAWGTVWDSDGLTHRERSILTIALLGVPEILKKWPCIFATANTKHFPKIYRGLCCAIYCGVPKAIHAFKIAKETYKEMGIPYDQKEHLYGRILSARCYMHPPAYAEIYKHPAMFAKASAYFNRKFA